MASVIQHNITAMNSNRMLGVTTSAQAKSTEKLSSGYKINRAADDAAGLSISEKMRKQIRGLTQASANAEDGISCVQTAEGALGEVEDMLQRMNELAVKASNGTNSESDRQSIQDEISQLTTEIDRVAETTKFNETYLLKGDATKAKTATFKYKTIATASAASIYSSTGEANKLTDTTTGVGMKITFTATASSADQNALAKSIVSQGISYSQTVSVTNMVSGTPSKMTTYTVSLNGDAANNYTVVQKGTKTSVFTVQNSAGITVATINVTWSSSVASKAQYGQDASVSGNIAAAKATAAEVAGESAAYYDKDGNKISENSLSKYFNYANGTTSARFDGGKVYDALGNRVTLNTAYVSGTTNLTASLGLKFHVGADSTGTNTISVNIDALSAKGLGVNGLTVAGTDATNANKAIDTIAAAVAKVSAQRSALGAVQNRLEHTINNLNNIVENTTSAESAIRDTDMASEMVNFSKNNILAQAGQSMLAQANQSNQGVLSLLG